MTNVYTFKNKRPKTHYLSTYVQWHDELCKWRSPGVHEDYVPHTLLWPPPVHKRFRPMPLPQYGEGEPDRLKVHSRHGLNTPEQSFHYGYKHFHKDPAKKKLRVLDAEKPLPHPLCTETRVEFQDPHRLPQLVVKQNIDRYGLPADRRPAFGIAPRIISLPPTYIYDDPTWQRDCHT